LSLDLQKLSLSDRLYLKGLFLDDEFLKQARSYYLKQIYLFIDANERNDFINHIKKISDNYDYNIFYYEVLQFLEDLKSTDKNISAIL
jgi:uncharacterized protein with NRDE domain